MLRPLVRARRARALPLPDEVFLLDEGVAVATYADQRAVPYATLEELLDEHELELDELEIVARVAGVGRWDP